MSNGILSYHIYGTPLPFVGRRPELEHLAHELQEAVTKRTARAVHVSGPAGVGKSRVVDAFTQALISQGHPVRSYWTSFSHRELEPGFAPLTQIIRQEFGIRVEDKDELARDKLIGGLVELVEGSRLNEAARLMGALLQLPFAFEFGEVDRGDLVRFMERAYQTCLNLILLDDAPVILVIDNMDAAPNTLSEWVKALTDALADSPVLILLIGRNPEEFPELTTCLTQGKPLVLNHLSDTAIQTSLGGFLGCTVDALPAGLAELASARVHGVPRNLENLLRLLIQLRVLTPAPDGWAFSPHRLTGKKVPETMRGIARQRILTLPSHTRQVLEAAAVLGNPFWMTGLVSLIEATTPIPADGQIWHESLAEQIRNELVLLKDMEMLHEGTGSALRGEEEYIFVSAFERHEVLEMIEPERKSLLHRLAGQWMARVEANEPSIWNAAIAQQFLESGGALGAARHLVLAANHARRAFNNSLAISLYEQALELLNVDQAPLLLETSAKLAWTHRMMGRASEAEALYRQCLKLARVLGDPREEARVMNQIGTLELEEGHYEEARTTLNRALAQYQSLRDLAGVAEVREDIGRMLRHTGARNASEEAMAQFEQSLALRQELGDDRSVARCLTELAHMLFFCGKRRDAERQYRAALEIRRSLGDTRGQAICMNGLGCLFHEKGEHSRAIQVWREVERLARSVGDLTLRTMAHVNLGEACHRLEQHAEAKLELDRASSLLEGQGDPRIQGHILRCQAELAIDTEEFEQAQVYCADMMTLAKDSGNHSIEALGLTSRAHLHCALFEAGNVGAGKEAEKDVMGAISLLEEMGDLVELERALKVQASLHRAYGSNEDAEASTQRAHSLRAKADGE